MQTRAIFLGVVLLVLSALTSFSQSAEASQVWKSRAITDVDQQRLYEDDYWRELNFYWRGIPTFGFLRSLASLELFLDPNGKGSPRAELVKWIERWDEPVEDPNQSIHCRMPRKSKWIQERLVEFLPTPKRDCPALQDFYRKANAKSVALVFSSYYMNNPSSSFGHTFLRMIPETQESTEELKVIQGESRAELLDFGINYAATTPKVDPITYIVGGLGGLFPGVYSGMPYYFKVREYNDAESRDLWSYHLSLNQEEVNRLVDRVWELGQVKYPYFYFTTNCSAMILHALEIAAPRFQLMKSLKTYVIPGDTIRIVTNTYSREGEKLVKSVDFRPSSRANAIGRISVLSPSEKKEFSNLRNVFVTEKLNRVSGAKVVDALLDDFDSRYDPALLDSDKVLKSKRFEILKVRAKFKEPPEKIDFSGTMKATKPDSGHPSGRVSLGFGSERGFSDRGRNLKNASDKRWNDGFAQLEMRFSLHDELDPQVGYPKYSKLEMIGTKVRLPNDGTRIWVEELTFARIRSLSALNQTYSSLSWQVDLGAKRFRDRSCLKCFGPDLSGGVGTSYEIANGLLPYGLLVVGSDYSSHFQGSPLRAHLGPRVGVLFNKVGFPMTFGYEADYRTFVFSNVRSDSSHRFEVRYEIKQGWTAGMRTQWYQTNQELLASLYHFF